MGRATTIRDIEIELEKLGAQKDDIDERVHGLEAALRHFESLPPEVAAGQRTEQITNTICEILEREHPLHRTVIYSRLQSGGIHVGGRDPVNNTGAYMSGDARFKSLGKGMWDLTEPPKGKGADWNWGQDLEDFPKGDGEQEAEEMPQGTIIIDQPRPRLDRTALTASRLARVGEPDERR